MVAELTSLYELYIEVILVKSEANLADVLTRVPKKWLKPQTPVVSVGFVDRYSVEALRDLHDTNHLGVDRTLHLSRCKWGDEVKREDVVRVVKECQVCRRLDPAPVRWDQGGLSVDEAWSRLASDITHYGGIPNLTLIDCGPGSSPYGASSGMKLQKQ